MLRNLITGFGQLFKNISIHVVSYDLPRKFLGTSEGLLFDFVCLEAVSGSAALAEGGLATARFEGA